MERVNIIQDLINKYKYSKYLEIGVQKGYSFFPIKCKKKIAVDPHFQISRKEKLKWSVKNFTNWNNCYFESTSDNFFAGQQKFLERLKGIDIVFIDGLHTFEATLKDINNSLNFLSNKGIIVVHDCFPPHKAAATPGENAEEVGSRKESIPGWNEEWCGDTWKAIAFLKANHSESLSINVINTDYGLGIIKKKKNYVSNLAIDTTLFELTNRLEYEDLMKDPDQLIGLREKEFYKEL